MSQTHTLRTNADQVVVVFHFDLRLSVALANGTPSLSGNNPVGKSYISAVKNVLGKGAPVSSLPTGDGTNGTITAAELADVQAGNIYESIRSMGLAADFAGLSLASQATRFDAWASAEHDAIQQELASILRYAGVNR